MHYLNPQRTIKFVKTTQPYNVKLVVVFMCCSELFITGKYKFMSQGEKKIMHDSGCIMIFLTVTPELCLPLCAGTQWQTAAGLQSGWQTGRRACPGIWWWDSGEGSAEQEAHSQVPLLFPSPRRSSHTHSGWWHSSSVSPGRCPPSDW